MQQAVNLNLILDQVAKDPNYHLQVQDILDWEAKNGPIPAGSVVMVTVNVRPPARTRQPARTGHSRTGSCERPVKPPRPPRPRSHPASSGRG